VYTYRLQRLNTNHHQRRAELQRRNQRLQEILNNCFPPWPCRPGSARFARFARWPIFAVRAARGT